MLSNVNVMLINVLVFYICYVGNTMSNATDSTVKKLDKYPIQLKLNCSLTRLGSLLKVLFKRRSFLKEAVCFLKLQLYIKKIFIANTSLISKVGLEPTFS